MKTGMRCLTREPKLKIWGLGGLCSPFICIISFACADKNLMEASPSSLILHIGPQGERDKYILAPKTETFCSSKPLQGHC